MLDLGGSKKWEYTPKWMLFVRENPMKMDVFFGGVVPPFEETSLWGSIELIGVILE